MRRRGRWTSGMAAMVMSTSVVACGEPSDDPVQGAAEVVFPTMTTHAEYEQALDDLSNWGRWGADDELGAANFITPAKRVGAAGLVTEGLSVSLAHDVVQERSLDGPAFLTERWFRRIPREPQIATSTRAATTARSTATSTPSTAT